MNATAFSRVRHADWLRILTMGKQGVEAARWYTTAVRLFVGNRACAERDLSLKYMEYEHER